MINCFKKVVNVHENKCIFLTQIGFVEFLFDDETISNIFLILFCDFFRVMVIFLVNAALNFLSLNPFIEYKIFF